MGSTYCTACNKQAGDNWTECYWCGGKDLREQESSSVSSIPEEFEEDLLSEPIIWEDSNYDDVEVSVERVRQLLSKDNLTESELDELSMGFIHYDELSETDKEKINMLFQNFKPVYTTKQRIRQLFSTIIFIVLISFLGRECIKDVSKLF